MILMLNCSYKPKESNTEYFLGLLQAELGKYVNQKCKVLNIRNILKGNTDSNFEGFVLKLKNAQALVIGAPLYVDGLPAQAVRVLELLLENYKGEFNGLPVYVVSSLGFYEAEQIRNLMSIVENWCERMGILYGGGLAIGAGPMVRALDTVPLKRYFLRDIGDGVIKLAESIVKGESMRNYYTKSRIPRAVYMKAAHITFGKSAKANGLKVSDVKC